MMRIAVAGGGGLGYLLALQLSQASASYSIVVLSRSERPEFGQLDVQLHVVNYDDLECLEFALQGVDLAISTISGPEQLSLINASAAARVGVFVPSEFEGSLRKRPSHNDPLDRGSARALALLKYWEGLSGMRYTVFACGIFMERFHPYGLGYLNIGYGSGVSGIGDYLVDINNRTAEYATVNARGHTVRVCMTSVYDVVRFVVAAIDLGPQNWPHELTMRGDRMSVRDVVWTCSRVTNGKTPALQERCETLIWFPLPKVLEPQNVSLVFVLAANWRWSVAFEHYVHQPADLQTLLGVYAQRGEGDKLAHYQQLVATTNGRYDFSKASLNEALEKSGRSNVQPTTLAHWLINVWQ
ncbi:hypothetical protein E4U21_007600 [Claviceps maximensis]|nr:hypothetical protein E4U21_007600 [Claviceps maximensis]